ncbi:MAG: SDR family oxidoreductase [Patescibacteria group bacterium]
MNKKLERKVIAIIGATGGIGDPIASLCIKSGARVLLGSRRWPELRDLRDRIDPSGQNSLAEPTDASKAGEITRLLLAGKKRFGKVDAVIVTVGTWRLTSVNTEVEEAGAAARVLADSIIVPSWNAIFEANRFLTEEGGIIFNLSSHVTLDDEMKQENRLSGNIFYRAAKEAVENVVNSLRLVSPKIRFVNLQPATVDTPTNRREHPEVPEGDWTKAVQPATIFDWIADHLDDPEITEEVYFPSGLTL